MLRILAKVRHLGIIFVTDEEADIDQSRVYKDIMEAVLFSSGEFCPFLDCPE